MIIHFEIKYHKRDGTYKSFLKWAYEEREDCIGQEVEYPDGEEVIGDRTYEGTPGQATRVRLIDFVLFDSPYSNAHHWKG